MARSWPRLMVAALGVALIAGICVPGQPVRADHIEIGTQAVDYCLTVANIDQFPDYVFFARVPPVGNWTRVAQGDCLRSTYKVATAHFYAIRADAFDPAAFAAIRTQAEADRYLTTTPGMLASPIGFDYLTSVDLFDPRAAVVDILRIVRVGPDTLDIEPESVRYTYHDGRTETLPYRTVNQRPVPARTPLWYFWVVPLAGLVGILVLLILDNRGRGRRRAAETDR